MTEQGSLIYCRKKCINEIMPFAFINDKEFHRLNTPLPKYPCGKCTYECYKNTNCIKCHVCMQWNHLECTSLTKKEFEKTDSYLCSKKCETKVLPFNTIDNKDFEDIHCHENYNIKHGYKRSAEPSKKNNKNDETKSSLSNSFTPSCDVINPNHIPSVLNFNDVQNFTLFHGNIASVNKNLYQVGELFQNCDIYPNIIGVTETKLKVNSDSIDIEGYQFEGCPTKTEAGGAGMFISNVIDYDLREDLSINHTNCEDIWIQVSTSNMINGQNKKPLIIGVVYRHPGGNFKSFCSKICKNIDDFNKNGIDFVIMGDVNVNLLKYNIVRSFTDYINDGQSAGCLSYIDKLTRVCKRGDRWESSLVDHVYSNIEPEKVTTDVIESIISNHFSCLTKIRGLRMKKSSNIKIYRRKKRLNEDEIVKLNSDLSQAFQGNSTFSEQKNLNDIASYVVSFKNSDSIGDLRYGEEA